VSWDYSFHLYYFDFWCVLQGLQPQQAAQPAPQQAGPQPGAAAQNGQPDYSAQWAEYYRSIGKVKEAEAIEAQMKAGKVN
jgi:far upstream element-binding protein